MAEVKTNDLNSFNYLESGEILFSIFDTVKTVKSLDPGLYNISYLGHPEYRVTLQNSTNYESAKIYNFAEKNKIDESIKAFTTLKVRQKLKELSFAHKLGVLLYGKEGGGKTSIVNYYCNQLITSNDAIVFRINCEPCYLSKVTDFILKVRGIQDNLFIVVMDEMEELAKENEGQVKTFMDGAESLDNTIFFGMTNYIDKIPSSIKNRPSRFKYCIEIEGIQSEKEIKTILDKMIGDIYEDEVIMKFSTDLKGNTLDQIKQFCIDKIMDISSTPITKKKIGFK